MRLVRLLPAWRHWRRIRALDRGKVEFDEEELEHEGDPSGWIDSSFNNSWGGRDSTALRMSSFRAALELPKSACPELEGTRTQERP